MKPKIYTINIEPVPAARARVPKVGKPYYPAKYRDWKEQAGWAIKAAGIPKGDYTFLLATVYIPYPKKTRKADLIEGFPHRVKPDGDNYLKAIKDALTSANILITADNQPGDDAQLSDGYCRKRRTCLRQGWIEVQLLTYVPEFFIY